MISPERINNAIKAYHNEPVAEHLMFNRMQAVLHADDLYRSQHPATPAPTGEPVLPAWLMFNGDEYLFNNGSTDSPKIINFSPAALRMVADHADWRESQQRQAEPVVTDEMVNAAIGVVKSDFQGTVNVKKMIAAALAAAPGKKEGES